MQTIDQTIATLNSRIETIEASLHRAQEQDRELEAARLRVLLIAEYSDLGRAWGRKAAEFSC